MRNPFRLLRSEHFPSDPEFLRMFGSSVLKVLRPFADFLWQRLVIITSSPGGGKTSLMRLFTPRVLTSLNTYRTSQVYSDVHSELSQTFNAFDEEGPILFGVMFPLVGSYKNIDKLNLREPSSQRFFLSLLDVSIGLTVLQQICTMHNLTYPDDLKLIDIDIGRYYDLQGKVPANMVNRILSDIEQEYLEQLDSFGDVHFEVRRGFEILPSLQLLKPNAMSIKGRSLFSKSVLMFDDFQNLSPFQMRCLLDNLVKANLGIGVWIASRTETLETTEPLPQGTRETRDYTIINLENFWYSNKALFRASLNSISDKRVSASGNSEITDFISCIGNDPLLEMHSSTLQSLARKVKGLAIEEIGDAKEAKLIYKSLKLADETKLDEIRNWQIVSILTERRKESKQLTLVKGDEKRDDSETVGVDIKNAADLFLYSKYKIPYYFGINKLVQLASNNFEQYLALAGDIFEESSAKTLLRKSPEISANRQNQLILDRANQRWNAIPITTRFGRNAERLLSAIGEYSKLETHLPNAPYAPGVTGIALTYSEFQSFMEPQSMSIPVSDKASDLRLFLDEYSNTYKESNPFAILIASCLANNLLVRHNVKQGGKDRVVLYLNRLLCSYFSLPLTYGGFRPIKLSILKKWSDRGFRIEDVRRGM